MIYKRKIVLTPTDDGKWQWSVENDAGRQFGSGGNTNSIDAIWNAFACYGVAVTVADNEEMPK